MACQFALQRLTGLPFDGPCSELNLICLAIIYYFYLLHFNYQLFASPFETIM